MLKKIVLLVLVLVIFSSASFAMRPAIVGGLRDDLAFGVYADQQLDGRMYLHTGLEVTTGNNPVIGLLGLSWYLDRLARRYPLMLNTALVIYAGDKTQAGINLSFAIERFLDVQRLFIEAGVDVVEKGGRLVLQLGYKL